jgi:hypothetical protein
MTKINSDLLAKFGFKADLPAVPKLVPVPAYLKKRESTPKREKHGPHKSFSDQLRDDTAWINEKLEHDKTFVTSLITVMLEKHLVKNLGHDLVLHSFYYQRSELDIISLHQDFITEFEVKTCRQDYARDFSKVVWKGRPTSKHGLMRSGEWLANRFYYVCPEGMIDLDHLPEYAGLITFAENPKNILTRMFTVVKEAPYMHKDRVSPGFYKTLSFRLYDRYRNHIANNRGKSILDNLTTENEQTQESNSEHNPADQGNINTGGQSAIPDPGRLPSAVRTAPAQQQATAGDDDFKNGEGKNSTVRVPALPKRGRAPKKKAP